MFFLQLAFEPHEVFSKARSQVQLKQFLGSFIEATNYR
jgi:hypothetical protein